MPVDCSVLRTFTILPNIRISRDIHPTFMLISGRGPRSFTHYEQAHVSSDLLTLASYNLVPVFNEDAEYRIGIFPYGEDGEYLWVV